MTKLFVCSKCKSTQWLESEENNLDCDCGHFKLEYVSTMEADEDKAWARMLDEELTLARRQYRIIYNTLMEINNFNHAAGCSESVPVSECGCNPYTINSIIKEAFDKVEELRKDFRYEEKL